MYFIGKRGDVNSVQQELKYESQDGQPLEVSFLQGFNYLDSYQSHVASHWLKKEVENCC